MALCSLDKAAPILARARGRLVAANAVALAATNLPRARAALTKDVDLDLGSH